MKNFFLSLLLFFGVIGLAFNSCTLDKEPDIPTGNTNIIEPHFLSTEIIPDTGNILLTKALLSSTGNLNMIQHGWVWGEAPEPTLQDFVLTLGSLAVDSFSTVITGLNVGKLYYLRPFVTTGMGTYYGPEQCSFLGVNFSINTDFEIFLGAEVQFTNTSPSTYSFLWNFGDGDSSTLASPKHTFKNAIGNVAVRLTATNSGCKVVKTIVLKIIADPFKDYWVSIPGGSFMMGCTGDQQPECEGEGDEVPAHYVTISPFFLGKTEITQEQWLKVLGSNPSFFNQCGLDCPVEMVSWDDVHDKFIPALSRKTGRAYRLPTEAEWEYAARGGQSFKFAGSDNLHEVGWGLDSMTHPVKQKIKNSYGLYDMSGNVWEHIEDDYHFDTGYTGAPIDGTAWIDIPRSVERVLRSGSWNDSTQYCRTANRYDYAPESRDSYVGFRLVRTY